mmetsp:Transcript_48766/g.150598  ORF Transcript_48766/g.150598 Transcript_48766/m.150598 type:complete len:245 (-) Transcript_48766:325-1059(-)
MIETKDGADLRRGDVGVVRAHDAPLRRDGRVRVRDRALTVGVGQDRTVARAAQRREADGAAGGRDLEHGRAVVRHLPHERVVVQRPRLDGDLPRLEVLLRRVKAVGEDDVARRRRLQPQQLPPRVGPARLLVLGPADEVVRHAHPRRARRRLERVDADDGRRPRDVRLDDPAPARVRRDRRRRRARRAVAEAIPRDLEAAGAVGVVRGHHLVHDDHLVRVVALRELEAPPVRVPRREVVGQLLP